MSEKERKVSAYPDCYHLTDDQKDMLIKNFGPMPWSNKEKVIFAVIILALAVLTVTAAFGWVTGVISGIILAECVVVYWAGLPTRE